MPRSAISDTSANAFRDTEHPFEREVWLAGGNFSCRRSPGGCIMKLCILCAATIAAVFILVRPSPAAAEFAVCNSTTYGSVNVAWAATWHDSNGDPHGESDGWWIIPSGECKIIIAVVDVSPYTIYIYAFATANPSTQWWGGNYRYCLDPKNKFLYKGDAMNLPCAAGSAYGMRFIDTSSESTYAYFLRD